MFKAIVILLLSAVLLPLAPAQAAAPCQFTLGFKTLADALPETIGQCTDNVAYSPANGDALQHATGGLLVWRKAENNTAFTDGYRTWVNGPNGIEQRLNTERFPWETAEGQTQPTISLPPLVPTATPRPTATPIPVRSCCKICDVGKACGNSCISRNYTCHQPPGCACDAQ
jgi:hypothetical protein